LWPLTHVGHVEPQGIDPKCVPYHSIRTRASNIWMLVLYRDTRIDQTMIHFPIRTTRDGEIIPTSLGQTTRTPSNHPVRISPSNNLDPTLCHVRITNLSSSSSSSKHREKDRVRLPKTTSLTKSFNSWPIVSRGILIMRPLSSAESDKGKLPSQPEQAKAITVLRSGKVVDNKVEMPEPKEEETHSEKLKEAEPDKATDEPMLHKSPNPYKPRVPFPDRLRDEKQEKQFRDLFSMLSKVNVNLPLLDVIKNMPSYGKFFKDLVTKKRKFEDGEKVVVYEAASAMQHDLPKKERDPGGFIIQIALGNGKVASGMLDLGAGINLMPFSIFQRLGLGDLRPTRMCLQLADRSIWYPNGIVEDVLVKVGKLIIPVDFVVLDVGDVHENGKDHTILLGRPFMATTNTLIDVKNGTLNMTVLGESVSISVREAGSASSVNFVEECAFIDQTDPFVDEMVLHEFEEV
ncbi:Unknown protein, partial [Striga hermonthica]